jgi:hypothetical protein
MDGVSYILSGLLVCHFNLWFAAIIDNLAVDIVI